MCYGVIPGKKTSNYFEFLYNAHLATHTFFIQIYFLKSKWISDLLFQKNFHSCNHSRPSFRFIWVNFLTSIKERTHKFSIAIIHFKSYFLIYVLKKWVRSALDTWKKNYDNFRTTPFTSSFGMKSVLLLWLLKYRKKSMNKESRKE